MAPPVARTLLPLLEGEELELAEDPLTRRGRPAAPVALKPPLAPVVTLPAAIAPQDNALAAKTAAKRISPTAGAALLVVFKASSDAWRGELPQTQSESGIATGPLAVALENKLDRQQIVRQWKKYYDGTGDRVVLLSANERTAALLERVKPHALLTNGAFFDATNSLGTFGRLCPDAAQAAEALRLDVGAADFVVKRLGAIAELIVGNSVSLKRSLGGARGNLEEELNNSHETAGHEWSKLPGVVTAMAGFRHGLAQQVFHYIDVALLDRLCKWMYDRPETPMPAESKPTKERASSLVYYIDGWILRYVEKRCKTGGDSFEAAWFWPQWALGNKLDPRDVTDMASIQQLPTAITVEREFGRLLFPSDVLFAYVWRVEQVYCTLVADEELSLQRGDVLISVLTRLMKDAVTDRLFAETVPPQLLAALSSRGESRKELLKLVLSLYAKIRGGDVTRKLMSHLHQATAAAAQRNAGNLRSSMAV